MMENKNVFDSLLQYRLKVEKDGKSVVDVPGILALPGMLIAPKLSIAGLVAAPLLGCKVKLEGEDGKPVDVEGAVRNAAETVADTVDKTARTIKGKMDEAWEAMSADDEDGAPDAPVTDAKTDEPAADSPAEDAGDVSNEDLVDELEKHENGDVPTIQVNPDDQ